jgi:hypothetical protein
MIGQALPKVGFEAYYLDQLFAVSGLSLARDYLSLGHCLKATTLKKLEI